MNQLRNRDVVDLCPFYSYLRWGWNLGEMRIINTVIFSFKKKNQRRKEKQMLVTNFIFLYKKKKNKKNYKTEQAITIRQDKHVR